MSEESKLAMPPAWQSVMMMLGVLLSGGVGTGVGASRAAADLDELQTQVGDLDDKVDRLILALAKSGLDVGD